MRAPIRLAACAACLLATILAGCQQHNAYVDYSRPPSAEDDAFAKGANRPATGKTYYAMARMLVNQGQDAQAEPLLLKSIQSQSNYMPAYTALAGLYLRRQDAESAIRTLREGLQVSPGDPVLLNDLGMVRSLQGQYQEALGLFSQALSRSPRDARYRCNLAMANGMLGRYDEAMSCYLQALPPAEAHDNLAVLAQARGDAPRAQQERLLAQRLRQDPKPVPATALPALTPASTAPAK